MDVDPVVPMAWKVFMMPHTVPKRPMKGVTLAVVARRGRARCRRSCSLPMALSRERLTPSRLRTWTPVSMVLVRRLTLICASSSA